MHLKNRRALYPCLCFFKKKKNTQKTIWIWLSDSSKLIFNTCVKRSDYHQTTGYENSLTSSGLQVSILLLVI